VQSFETLSVLSHIRSFATETGALSRFAARVFAETPKPGFEWRELLRQCYLVGNRSLPLVGSTAFIMGMVLTIQLRPALLSYGVESELPYIVADAIIREIGPVITGLIFAGKVGSGIGAELGSMQVTEQIDAMEVSGTNPFRYLVVTRVMATTLMLPLLVVVADAISLTGCYIGLNIRSVTSLPLFIDDIFRYLEFRDVFPPLVKTFFFGFCVGTVGCYKGYNATKGTESVGKSANEAVVVASMLIFLLDLVAVQVTDLLGFN
jgi:phospholipid/cholesterol/gamma-HCH transport system permease protein